MAELLYEPDNKLERVQRHNGADKRVPHLWVVFRCSNPKHKGAVKLDAYQGPPYCREHNCYLEPVNLGVEHSEHNSGRNERDASAAGRPHK